MATAELEWMLDEWAIAWSSSMYTDPQRVLALFADDGMDEDATSGAMVRRQKERHEHPRAGGRLEAWLAAASRIATATVWPTMSARSDRPAGGWAA